MGDKRLRDETQGLLEMVGNLSAVKGEAGGQLAAYLAGIAAANRTLVGLWVAMEGMEGAEERVRAIEKALKITESVRDAVVGISSILEKDSPGFIKDCAMLEKAFLPKGLLG